MLILESLLYWAPVLLEDLFRPSPLVCLKVYAHAKSPCLSLPVPTLAYIALVVGLFIFRSPLLRLWWLLCKFSINGFFFLVMYFTILSLNICGLCDADKRSRLIQWLRSLPSSTDFICLQETHCVSDQEARSWFSSVGYCVTSSCRSLRSCGCMLLYRPVAHILI